MCANYVAVENHDDFPQVYNLDDPRSYFRALQPLGYRAPTVMAEFIEANADAIRAARRTSTLRLLDFACGYGPIGALLRHDLTFDALYARFADDDSPATDAKFFKASRRERSDLYIGGLDTADRAVDYAITTGFVDIGFSDDLLAAPPGTDLANFLTQVDVIIESGSITSVLPTCFARIIDAAERPPWFVQSPRGDTDPTERLQMFADYDYVVETATDAPIRYRRLMSNEADEVFAATRAVGHDPDEHFDDGWFLVPIQVARPRSDAAALPISALAVGPF